ncbi:serpin family protein [Flavobacteriaceae bacterium F89]|uniref:Serpin family protein n=1 Tax=Cerina litoralis TaxID=2874477 RepID=A0AAE3ES09_9FLAO|nr:serpin family protein [Cerina litoralis]MCG2460167.1 serpin family protein [Cerina litoralis]
MRFTFFVVVFATLLLLQGCEKETQEPLPSFESVAKSKQIVSANNEFAFSLFKKIAANEEKTNFMISPVSASLALGMVYNGAAGETRQAFDNTLHYGDATLEETNAVNQNIIDNLTYSGSGSTFKIANSIWVENTFPVKDSFTALNEKFYNAKVANMDFGDPQTLNTINNWASDNTNGKIPTILNNIDSNSILFAINALYFNSEWKYRFDADRTKDLPFHGDDGLPKSVAMMTMEQNLSYYFNDTFSSVVLPYKNDKYAMTLLLPHVDKSITDVVNIIDGDQWSQLQANFTSGNLTVTIPKFTFSYKKKLNDILKDLGLGIAFNPDLADFSELSDVPTYISLVLQKTYIDVNEKGTEAAAVTAVGMGVTSAGPGKPLVFDRPFLFAITEKETGSICFIGKVGMPEYDK